MAACYLFLFLFCLFACNLCFYLNMLWTNFFCINVCRVRKLTEMTEKMSASLLDVVVSVTGSISAPLFQSKAGKSFISTVPGEVLLASLDAISRNFNLLSCFNMT